LLPLAAMMKHSSTTRPIVTTAGFSLVELMVVLAVLVILASIAVPAYTVWVPNYKLKAAAREVYSALQLAKLRAVKENTNVVIWFDINTNRYRAFLDDGTGAGVAGNNTQDGTEPTIKEGTLDPDVTMYNTVFSTWSNQTVFNSRGLASGGWGYVYLKNSKGQYRRITVWTTGHLKMETSSDGVNWS